jgi:hypothetical protein
MGRIISGQVIASTALDSHGERLSRETIETLFRQLPEVSFSFHNHDTSVGPVCRGFNKHLQELPSGELAIALDLEVLDEEAFQSTGGFSIAFINRTIQFGSDPVVKVLVNPRQFPFDQMAEEIGQLLPPGESIDVSERIEKTGVLETAIIVVAIAVGGVATGFLNKIGAELFDYLKKLRTGNPPTEPTIHVQTTVEVHKRPVVLVLVADPATPPNHLAQVDVDAVTSQVESLAGTANVQRCIGVIRPGPTVELRFLVRADGAIIKK